jgi:hypothetical protein
MKTQRVRLIFSTLAVLALVVGGAASTDAQESLPSWNDGSAKQAIVEFVSATTETGGAKFVPPEERIATFDQDGTLWVEHPIYSQMMYCLDRVARAGQGEAGIKERRTIQNCALRQL